MQKQYNSLKIRVHRMLKRTDVPTEEFFLLKKLVALEKPSTLRALNILFQSYRLKLARKVKRWLINSLSPKNQAL